MNVFEVITSIVCLLVAIVVILETLFTKQNSDGLSAAMDRRPVGNIESHIDFKERWLNRATAITVGIIMTLVFVLNVIAAHVSL